MKLHLPFGLRKALMACLTAMSVALPSTLGSASGIAAVFAAVSVMAPQQAEAETLTWTNEKAQWEEDGSVWEEGTPDPGSDRNLNDGWKNNMHFSQGDSATFGEAGTEGAQSGNIALKGAITAQDVTIAVGEWTWERKREDTSLELTSLTIRGTLTVNAGATLTLTAGGPGTIALTGVTVQDKGTLRLKVGDDGVTDMKITVGGTKTLNGTLEIELGEKVGSFTENPYPSPDDGGLNLEYVNPFVNGATKGANSELKLTNGDEATLAKRRVNLDKDYSEMLKGLGCLTIGEGIQLYYAAAGKDTLKSADTVKEVKLEGGGIFVEDCDATIGGSVEVAGKGDISTLDVRQPFTVTLDGGLSVHGYMKVRGAGGFVVTEKGSVTVGGGGVLEFALRDAGGPPVENPNLKKGNAWLRGAVSLSGAMAVEQGYIIELNGALTMTDGSNMTLNNEGLTEEEKENGIKSTVIFGNGFSVAEGSIGKVTVGAGTELRNAQMPQTEAEDDDESGHINMRQIEVAVDGTLDVGVNGMTVNMFSGGEGGVVKSTDGADGVGGGTLTLQDGSGGTFGGTVESNLAYYSFVGEGEKGKYTVNNFTGNALHVVGGELTVNTVTGDETGLGGTRDKHTVQVDNGQTLHVGELSGYFESVTVGEEGELSKITGGDKEAEEGFEVFSKVATGELGGHIGTLTMGARSTLDIVELSASIVFRLQVDGGTKNEETGEVTYSTFNVVTLSSENIPLLTMGNYVASNVAKLGGNVKKWTVGDYYKFNVGILEGTIGELTMGGGAEGEGNHATFEVGTLSGSVTTLTMGDHVDAKVGTLSGTISELTMGGGAAGSGNHVAFGVDTFSGSVSVLTVGDYVDTTVGTLSGKVGTWTMGDGSALMATTLEGKIGVLSVGTGGALSVKGKAAEEGKPATKGELKSDIDILTMEGGSGSKFDVDVLSGSIVILWMGDSVTTTVGEISGGISGWRMGDNSNVRVDELTNTGRIGMWEMGNDSSLTTTTLGGRIDVLSMGERGVLKVVGPEGEEGEEPKVGILSSIIGTLRMGAGSTFTADELSDEADIGTLTMGNGSTFTVKQLGAHIGTLSLGVETTATVENMSGRIDNTVIGEGGEEGTTRLTVNNLGSDSSFGNLTLNGGRLDLDKGKLNVDSFKVGEKGGTIHIRMDKDNTPATVTSTTFANALLDRDMGGKVTLEVELADIYERLNKDEDGNPWYQLFEGDGLLDDQLTLFGGHFTLSYNISSDSYSENDRKRWSPRLEKDGRLIFERSSVSPEITWTIGEADENSLTWKDGGTRTESGWDEQEIFRQGDRVTFTVDTAAEGHNAGPYTVTLEGPIEAGTMTVSEGVFNFVLKSQGEAPAEEGVTDLTVTGDLTVNEGATANVRCSLEVMGVTRLAGTTLTLGGGATLGDLVGSGGTLSVSGGEVTVAGVRHETTSETPTVEVFSGTLEVGEGGTLTLGSCLVGETGEVTLNLNGGTIVLAKGENELVPTVTQPEGGGDEVTEKHVVQVGAGENALRFDGGGMEESSLTAELSGGDGAGSLTLANGTFNLNGATKGEVKLEANTGLVGDALRVAGVSSGAETAALGGTVVLTGVAGAEGEPATGDYTYAGWFMDGLKLRVEGGTQRYGLGGQTIEELVITGGRVEWGGGETARKLSITGGGMTWEGNLTVSSLNGTVNLGNADKSNTLTLADHPDKGGETGGTYAGKLTLGTLDVGGTGTHTVKDGDIGTLKVDGGATLVTVGGTLSVGEVSAEGTVELQGSTLGLNDGANTLGTLRVVGAENNRLQLGGGELATRLDGSGVLSVEVVGEEGTTAALTLGADTKAGGTGENVGVTVDLGRNTRLAGEGATLGRVTGTGAIEATGLILTGTGASEAGYSGTIASGASVTLQGGSWTLGNARIDGALTTQGALTLSGKVVLNHRMTVNAGGSLAGTGTLDIQMSNAAAAAARGAIVLNGSVGAGTIGGGIDITFSGDAAVGGNARWTYQLFDLRGADFGEVGFGAFRDRVLEALGSPSAQLSNFQYDLRQDGVLFLLSGKDGEQHWVEGDAAFTWKNANGTEYNKWTVGIDGESGGTSGQEFSPLQDVEFAGKSTEQITVTVDGDINITGYEMAVSGRNGGTNYRFVFGKPEGGEAAGLRAGKLIIEAGVEAEFAVSAEATEVRVGATEVSGTLVLSGDGRRDFGDVTVGNGASVWVNGWGNLTGHVHGEGTLYLNCGTADTSIVSVGEGHTLANVEVVQGTTLDLGAGSEVPLGRITNLKVDDGASLTVSDASAVAGETKPSVHIAGAGVGGNGALAVKEGLGEVTMTGWNITLDGETSFGVGAGSELKYNGVLNFGADAWLTKVGGGVLEFTGGMAVGRVRVQQGTLRFSGGGKNPVAVGEVALSPGTTLESTITGTLGTLSGSGNLRVNGGALTVTGMEARPGVLGFSGGGSLDVGAQAVTGGTLEVGAGGGTLRVEMTGDGNNLTFGALTQVEGGKLTLHLTGFGEVFPTAETEGTYQLFGAPEFKALWDNLVKGNPEATWRDYFNVEVEGTNRLDVELGTSEGAYGQLNFTMDAGIVWQGGSDRMWAGDAGWTGGVAPGENDNVTFDGAGQGEVILDGEVKAKDVWVESGSYTFTGKPDAPDGEVRDTLTLTVGNLVVQGGASLNLNVGLEGHSDGTEMLVVLRGDETKGDGELNVQEQGSLGSGVHLQLEGGQLVFDSTSNPGDLSGKVLADRSTSGVKVKVVGADAKGNAWGREDAQHGNAPSGGVALALEKGIEKSGDGVFTLYWKDSGETPHTAAVDVVGGTLVLDVSGDTTLGGAMSLGGELDVKSTMTAAVTGAVTGAGTLKATGGQVSLTGDTTGFSGTVAADSGAVLTLSGAAVPVAEGKGTVNLKVGGNGGTVAINGGSAELTLRGQVSGSGAGVTLRNAGSGEMVVVGNAAGNGSGAKLDGGTGGIVLGTVAERATWAGSEVTGGDVTLRNVTLQGGLKAKGGKAHIYVDTTPVNSGGAAAAAAAVADGGVVDLGGTDVGLLDGITVNREGEVRGLGGGTYNVGESKKLTLYFTAESWGKSEAEKGETRAPVQGSGFDIQLAGGNATEGGLQFAFDYDIVKWFRTSDTLYLHALDGGTWNANGTVLDWANMEDSVAQMLEVVVGQNYTFTSDGLVLHGIARDLYVVMDGEESDAAESNSPKDLSWDAENQEGRRSTVVLDGKTLTLKWDGSTAAAGTPDGQIPNLLGSAGTHLQIQNSAASGKTGVNRLEVALNNSDQGGIRDGRFEGADGSTHFPEAEGTKVQGVDTTFLGSITGEVGVDLTKNGKGTLTVGGNYSLVEGTTKITEGALVLRGTENTLKDIEFAYTTAQDKENREARRGLELTGGGKTTVTGVIRESNGEGLSGDVSVTKEAGLVLKDSENTLVSTGISGDNTGVLELAGKAGLTLGGDGTKRQLGGVAVKLGAEATLDTGKDKSDLTALSGSGRLESTEGGVVTLRGENTFSGTLAASGEGVNAGKLKLADGAKFTFANTKSTATGTGNAWDVELGKNVTLTLDVSGKSGKAADCLTLGDVSLGDNSVTVEFGDKAIGEHYLAANLTNIGEGSSLTFHSNSMVKGNMKVDSGLTVSDPAARGTFGEHVHFTGVVNFLTEQNVTVDEAGKVWFEYKANADNKLLSSEYGVPGAGKNGRAGANMLWDSLRDKSQSPEFLDAFMNQQLLGQGGYYGLIGELVQRLDAGNTGDMERVLTSVAGASIATLGPALAEDVHRQLKSIRNRATSLVNDGEEEDGASLIRHAWINGETGYYKLDADGFLPGFTLKNWGGTVGVDMNVGKKTVVALALSAMYGDLEPDAAEVSDGSLDTTWLSGVVQTTRGHWTHTVVVSVGMADAEINRTVNYGSNSYRTTGSTDGYAYGALYEVGYTHLLDKQGRTAVQPVANIEWRHVTLDSYTEQGGNGAGLNVDEISQDAITIGVGARLQTILGANWVNHATLLETRALVKADIGDRSGTADNAIVGMGGKGRSEVETAEIGAVGVEVGAGVTVPLGPRAGSVFADASLEWRSGWTAIDATVGYKISF